MMQMPPQDAEQPAPPQQPAARRVLVVDDSPAQRKIVTTFLRRWGYECIEADSGRAALKICQNQDIDVVVSDWMMPGMSGLEFCRAFRQLADRPYGYFILLTSKSEKPEVARGLDMGADDFLTKPVSAPELLARIRAGERILTMERELREKNAVITKALAQLSEMYEALDADLMQARQLQHSLVRERHRKVAGGQVSVLLRSSGHVGGDFVGFHGVSDEEIAVFALDVSGHGVAPALLTARLAGLLTSPTPSQNLALEEGPKGPRVSDPARIADRLNRAYFRDIRADHYFTAILARARLNAGIVDLVQCGHPRLLLQDGQGRIRFLGEGGFPIGMFEEVSWQSMRIELPPGGKLLIASDGMVECPAPDGAQLGQAGLARLFAAQVGKTGTEFLESLVWSLSQFAGDRDFPDDVSAVLLERSGQES